MRKQVRKLGILMKGYGPVNTITSFCRNKCGNFDQNPTASIKSYWEPGYRDTPLFPRLPKYPGDYRVSQKNSTPHCGLICRLSLSFYNLIDTGPFFCVYQEKNMWWNLSENKKVAEILHFCSMEGIFKFMQIQTIKL